MFKYVGIFLVSALVTFVLLNSLFAQQIILQDWPDATGTQQIRSLGTESTLVRFPINEVDSATKAVLLAAAPNATGFGSVVIDTQTNVLYMSVNQASGGALLYKIAASPE